MPASTTPVSPRFRMRTESAPCFTIRILTNSEHPVYIRGYDDNARPQDTHNRVDLEVWHDGALVFPYGQLWIGIPSGHCTDSVYAKAAAVSCVAMKPGDTDADYFASYTPAQLEWAECYAEHLAAAGECRYRKANGELKAR